MKQCELCGRPLNDTLNLDFILSFRPYREPIICRKCQQRFEQISNQRCCQDCDRAGNYTNQLCSDCQRWRRITGHRFRNHSLYRYNLMMSKYMRRYKFQGDYRLRKVFQKELSRFVNQFERSAVPIPIHPSTYQRRGFNQVQGLLKNVQLLNVLTTRDSQKTIPQSNKTKADRLRLVQPFKIRDGFANLIKGQNLVVIDDVYTTGTTMHYAVGLLKQNGARSVISVTLAR